MTEREMPNGKETIMGTQQSYIRNLANSIIGELGVTGIDLGDLGITYGAQTLYQSRHPEILSKLSGMRDETLGKIAACGRSFSASSGPKTSLYEVHGAPYLDKCASGRALMMNIACTAIVAEMADILGDLMREKYRVK